MSRRPCAHIPDRGVPQDEIYGSDLLSRISVTGRGRYAQLQSLQWASRPRQSRTASPVDDEAPSAVHGVVVCRTILLTAVHKRVGIGLPKPVQLVAASLSAPEHCRKLVWGQIDHTRPPAADFAPNPTGSAHIASLVRDAEARPTSSWSRGTQRAHGASTGTAVRPGANL